MRSFIEQRYSEDGDGIPSAFMREISLRGYEPGCIEAIYSAQAVPLPALLAGASYSDQWLSSVSDQDIADAAICVYEPNVVERPVNSSLIYIGAFSYTVKGKASLAR